MSLSTRKAIVVTLVGVLAVLCLLAAVSFWLGLVMDPAEAEIGVAEILATGLTIAGGIGIWHIYGLVTRHFHEIERLRGAIVTLTGNPNAVLPLRDSDQDSIEAERLYAALGDLALRYQGERAVPDRRLGAILASVSEALLVITEQGQVSLVNYPAKALLGGEEVRVGTSVFAALERDSVIVAVERARRAGHAVEASLKTLRGTKLSARVVSLEEHAGAVVSFSGGDVEHRAELEHDLDLHDQPPAHTSPHDDTPLHALHATVLDTETTGLDPTVDRVIAIGAVRVCGGRLYRGLGFDRLVRPGVPIPARSTAVHGITESMVQDAETFPAVYADFEQLVRDTIWVGHNVAFDVAILRRETKLAGLPWHEPRILDTLLLAATLDLGLPGLSLENLAERFGVNIRGRHTALGDSLVTAEVYVRMLPLLQDAGVQTLGAAVAFSRKAKQVIARQKAAGW